MTLQVLNTLSGNFNSQSFDIDQAGVTTNVASKYEPIPGANNVLSNEAPAQEIAAPAATPDLNI